MPQQLGSAQAMLKRSCKPRTHHATFEKLHAIMQHQRSRKRMPSKQYAHLNTFPSAHSYFFPSTSIGLSHAHISFTNSLSSSLVGSSLVNA